MKGNLYKRSVVFRRTDDDNYEVKGLSVETLEGETIEQKLVRVIYNKEPIKDGAPIIYTERKDGVPAGYNIRTDRWEVAADAMDLVSKNIAANRDGTPKADMTVSKGGGSDTAESTQAAE